MTRQNKIKKNFTNLFKKNIKKKIIALLVTFGIFIYFQMSNITEKTISVPLEISKPKRLFIASETPKSVNFYLSGTKASIETFDNNLLKAHIQMKEKKAGVYSYKPIIKGKIPHNIKVIRVSPDEINIKLSIASIKYVDLEPEFISSPKKGFSIVDYKIFPSKVKITGPKEILNSIVSLKTEPISIKNLEANKEFEISINKNVSSLVQFQKEKKYKVKVHIHSKSKESIFPSNIPIKIINLRESLKILEQTSLFVSNIKYQISINQEGEENLSLKNIRIQSIANLKEVNKAGTYNIKVDLIKPRNWQVFSYEPTSITLNIIEKKESKNQEDLIKK